MNFDEINWLDASKVQEISSNIQKRIDELEPGIIDAREQLSETQRLVDEAQSELNVVNEDLDLINTELESDKRDAKNIKTNHTHKLPRALTETAKRKSEVSGKEDKSKKLENGQELEDFLNNTNTENSKLKFWRRIFRRNGGSK